MFPSARSGLLALQGLRHGFWNQDRSSTVPPIVYEVLESGRGRPLDDSIRTRMERSFGYNFSRVRIHADARAAESAREVNARAYTVGWDVVFGAGQYAPSSRLWLRLFAHELAHVVQQTSSPAENLLGTGRMSISQPADRFERSADEAADAVMRGVNPASFALSGLPAGPVLQRDVDRNITYNALFLMRLASVRRERGQGPYLARVIPVSIVSLEEETGHWYLEWKFFFETLFRAMYHSIGSFPAEVVRDAAWASAIYEWAARTPFEEETDWHLHLARGAQLRAVPGSGETSIGPFQAYASMSLVALQNRDVLRFLADSDFAQSDPGVLRILSRVMNRRFTPGPTGSMWSGPPTPIGGDRWMRTAIGAELSSFDTMSGPVVSLIGKLQLSLRLAQMVADILDYRRLPDPVLRWVLLCHESHGEATRYVREVARRFDRAHSGSQVSLEDLNPAEIEGRLWDRRESLRLVFSVLGIEFAEVFEKR